MSLKRLSNEGKLEKKLVSKEEIEKLFKMVERDLKDSNVKAISADRRFATAYNAALQLSTIIIRLNGYRTRGAGHHYSTFLVLKVLLGKDFEEISDYFDACRAKRNITDYVSANVVSEPDVEELIGEINRFKNTVIIKAKEKFPEIK